ncbi:glycosyltransferase family 4 protein [Massilia pseudoviolaceinigra]|uniref:glycosyltransferase family 4 protein n=1 Tax=Massilia pseudoviolaceinigra TaxID=3057165 RepID=UPI00279663AA|nr:glycosyltransferase family 4 protein [Massilia sp. CCM 9206]MDQ1923283.1 glycosyltransferase family 4 protein [Massilia sp. CCM 9206]
MNILLINHYAGSLRHGMEYRPFYLAREWVRLGHTVRIIASSQSHIRAQAPQLHGQPRLDETIDGVSYRWIATPAYRGNGAARVVNMLAFVAHLQRHARQLAAEFAPDVVIASSTYPLDIWPAHRIARLAGARLLFELHDLWPLSPIELGGYSRWHPFIMLLQAAENYACRNACAIVSILPKVRDHLEAHGMAPHKLHIVPNGADPAEWLAEPPALSGQAGTVLAALRHEGKFIVGYAGTHGVANALDTLLDAAALVADQRIAFVLAGGGPDKPRLAHLARERGLHHVHFLDPVPKEQVPALLACFDVAYIGWQRQRLYRYGIAPNKLIDYMMAGRPILHSVEAGNDPVADARCGLTVAPQDPAAVAHGLLALFTLDPYEREAAGQRGRAYAMANLSYPVLGRRFLQACA